MEVNRPDSTSLSSSRSCPTQLADTARSPEQRRSAGIGNNRRLHFLAVRFRNELANGALVGVTSRNGKNRTLRKFWGRQEGVGLEYASTGQSKIMQGKGPGLAMNGHSDRGGCFSVRELQIDFAVPQHLRLHRWEPSRRVDAPRLISACSSDHAGPVRTWPSQSQREKAITARLGISFSTWRAIRFTGIENGLKSRE